MPSANGYSSTAKGYVILEHIHEWLFDSLVLTLTSVDITEKLHSPKAQNMFRMNYYLLHLIVRI